MNVETISHYINVYGYIIIFIFLFFGIVGIPAPEESLLFFLGILILHNQLSLILTLIFSILGAFIGMLTAYAFGKILGNSFISKYGKYIGITNQRLEKVKDRYSNNVHKSIILGFYMPGIRQINPYFAGITKIPFLKFVILSLIGAIIWTVPFILGGYYSGKVFNINPKYVPYLGVLFLFIFLISVLINYLKKNSTRIRQ
ncbi:DedA family protein [Bacillus sp. RG28]|uniref:DedA family protein n=1 Tax=Gottfriedia endophytica TaxID=2820819 RepID=A0A940NR07_9BACI|nr:DedA family protein [Gottfriedia endophytica]MBP0726689.1 DedA family protein [Gottfriedia endophytica]